MTLSNQILDVAPADYDFRDEIERVVLDEARGRGPRLVRSSASVNRRPTPDARERESAFGRHALTHLAPSTLRHLSPVIDVTLRSAGHFFQSPDGLCFDSYLGVGQQLFDKEHTEYRRLESELVELGIIFRRESATNDFLASDYSTLVASPHSLAARLDAIARTVFGGELARAYLCSSGTEAIEASLKIAAAAKTRYLVGRYGGNILHDLASELTIPAISPNVSAEDEWAAVPQSTPYYIVAPFGGFHGRSAGSLSCTTLRPVHRFGFPSAYRVLPVVHNEPGGFDASVVREDLASILAVPGQLRSLLDHGLVPADLIVGAVLEVIQGEAGYEFSEPRWMREIAEQCRNVGGQLIVDEIQTFGRTGAFLASEWAGLEPDIVAVGKGSVVPAAIARRSLIDPLPLGWHSSTWGGGRVLDNALAFKTLELYDSYRDPSFLGMTGRENQIVKAGLIEAGMQVLAEKHPAWVKGYRGRGGLWIVDLQDRDRVVAAAWAHGLKALTCGVTKDVSGVRALFLADVLTHEVLEYFRVLDITLASLS